jgi:hypothetical protein
MLVFQLYKSRILINSLAVSIAMSSWVYGKAWRSITPLHSDRAYVERLLGKPTMDNGDTVVYEYETERASIEYSKEPCSDNLNSWNVPRNTVLSVWVTPKSSHWTLDTFSIDPRRYNKLRDEHVLNIIHYRSETEGVEYNLNENTGAIVLVKYLSTKNDNHLRCRTATIRPPVTKTGETIDSNTLFDSYGRISFTLEKQRLDVVGRRLRERPSARTYIVAHGGQTISIKQALSYANRAKNYLIRKYKLPNSSIEIIQGDPQGEFKMNLYLVQ